MAGDLNVGNGVEFCEIKHGKSSREKSDGVVPMLEPVRLVDVPIGLTLVDRHISNLYFERRLTIGEDALREPPN